MADSQAKIRELQKRIASLEEEARGGRESENYFRTLVEKSYELIVILERDGRIRYISPSVENVLGFGGAELTGRLIFDFIHPDDLPRAAETLAALTAEARATVTSEFRILDRAGQWRNLEGTGRSLFNDPAIRGIVINAHDVTQSRQAEKALRQARENLEERVGERTAELEIRNEELRLESLERRRAVLALRASEKKYKALAENNNDIVYTVDSGGILTYVSPQIERYGYNPAEIVSHAFTEFILPEDRESALADFQITAETGGEFPTQFRILDRSGNVHWVEENGSVLRDESGNFTGLTGILRDITERKKVEAELQKHREHLEELVRERTKEITKSNRQLEKEIRVRKMSDLALREGGERYRLLIENAGNPIYMIDCEGNLLMLNNLAASYLGGVPREVSGKNIRELFPARFARRHLGDVSQAVASGQGVNVEYAVRLLGKKMWFKVNIQPYGGVDGKAAAQVIAQDITELKKVQAQLRKERDSLEIRLSRGIAALRSSELQLQERLREQTCLFNIRQEFDSDQAIEEILTRCASHIHKTLHQPGEKIVGINLDGVQLTPDGWDYLTEHYLESLLQIGGVKRGFLRVKALRPEVEFLPFEQDLIQHAGASLGDFIHNRELRSQLIQTEKMAAAGRLAAGVAHEINNPLGAIKNSLYIIKRSISVDHPDYSYFELMNSEIDRVAGIISQLYNLYKPSSREVQAVDLRLVAGNVLKMLDPQIRRRKIVVQNEIEGAGFHPRLPVSQITQVLYNLILNAVQAMPQGGRLTLGLTRAGSRHELWVSDTGPGIPDDILQHIFEPFFTTKTKGGNPAEGMGIGLSLSRSFMEALGGKISVKTRPGWGTTFSLIFPAKVSRGEAKQPGAS